MEVINWSPVFGYRKYRILNILSDFCNKYYNNDLYEHFLSQLDIMYDYISKEMDDIIKSMHPKSVLNIPATIEKLVADFIGGQHIPNGEYNWPDHIVDILDYKNVHLDTKCVQVDNDSVIYSNSCGQMTEVANHILNHYKEINDDFYLSFIVYIYYTKEGKILDVMIVPMIYGIRFKKYDWNDLSTFKFAQKSNGNFNVPLCLPSFLEKNGMMTLEEKELALATATYNYYEGNIS